MTTKKMCLIRDAKAQPPQLLILAFTVQLLLMLQPCFAADKPADAIFIACGSTGNSNTIGRQWIGDDDPKYSPLDHQKSLALKASSQPSSVFQVPYSTARVSCSSFTYSFSVTPGPKFVRLHFFSSDYSQNFSKSDAVFSVNSGPFTLLWNFSVSLMADNPSFFREFCLVVDGNRRLNLIFTPSTDHPGAYALINGIEVVSMPPDLYYSNRTNGSRNILYVPTDDYDPFTLSNAYALETVHRINVGGASIAPHDDTGMFRSWTAPDDLYLTEDFSSVSVNLSINLNYTQIADYAAPENVYKTARTMGPYRKLNTMYNLTWSFEVDPYFNYLVRLHFCEFQSDITSSGERAFDILIESQRAEAAADIIRWSGGTGSPTYRDYAVDISGPVIKKVNLTVTLRTDPVQFSAYADVILNGVEVLKISSSDGNLAGNNNNKTQILPPEYSKPKSGSITARRRRIVALAVGVGIFSILVLLPLLYFLIFRRERCADLLPSGNEVRCSDTAVHISFSPSDVCRLFSLIEIKAATNNFDGGSIVGNGGFGNVYRANTIIGTGPVPVAMKRLNPGSQQGATEFVAEIEMLSQLRHRHLVSLIGFCHEEGEMILVYDYMSRGTLRDHLYNNAGKGNPPLGWRQRLEICLGAARGLQYLHMGTKHTIIHRDIKTTNILLDEEWVAKVSDFGLSKFARTSGATSKSYVSTMVKGTFGYLDPEYFRFLRLTEKSDVYSFGVVLFEVLCARPPVDTNLETEQIGLAVWVQSCYHKGCLDQIIDPRVKDGITPECLDKFVSTAMSCLHDEGMRRPSMNDVVRCLEVALQLQLQEGERQEVAASLGMDNVQLSEYTTSPFDMESEDDLVD